MFIFVSESLANTCLFPTKVIFFVAFSYQYNIICYCKSSKILIVQLQVNFQMAVYAEQSSAHYGFLDVYPCKCSSSMVWYLSFDTLLFE